MGLFRKSPKDPVNYNDPALDDGQWMTAGSGRFESLISNHYGSPETIADGGAQRIRSSDPAAALYFYQKSIDTLHSIYVGGFNGTGPGSWSRQPSPRDSSILKSYLDTLRTVRQLRPQAPVSDSVKEVTHRVRAISTQFKEYGVDCSGYLACLDELRQIAPDVDVSGIRWQ